MFATLSNPSAAYRKAGLETQIDTASAHQLVLMLFDGAVAAIATATMHLADNDMARKGEAISRAISIIDGGLKACLDHNAGGKIAEQLAALYEYMCTRLLYANLRNDRGCLDEVTRLLGELRSAWQEIADDPAVVSQNKAAA